MANDAIGKSRRQFLGASALALSGSILGVTSMSTTPANAAAENGNPFTLVYGGAITRNEPGKVNIHPVTYKLGGLDIVANV